MKNIMLIGAGPHSRRIHIPILDSIKNQYNYVINSIVDLQSQKETIEKYLVDNKRNIKERIYLSEDESKIKNNKLTSSLIKKLDIIVKENKIDAIFICTEPSSHVAYAIWGLNNGLHILMDKPISTPTNLSNSTKSIKQINKDYAILHKLYLKQKKKYPNLVFELLAQRRYHAAFVKIKELIDEVTQKTGVPITSFQTTHCDGQWRMPKEIIEQNYHPYNQGYGKCSHSGYHSIDIINWLVMSSIKNEKQFPHNIEIFSNFMYPKDFINQLPFENYIKMFDSSEMLGYNISDYIKKTKNFGEIDAQISITYKNKYNQITTIGQWNLLHNSFSQRNWPTAVGKDLYKGNGRIRHELHYIVQGPFQTIIFESYQSEEILNKNTNNSNIGGEYHLDIHVFRNSKMFNNWKSYTKITIDDLQNSILRGYSRGHQEDARRLAIISFLKSIDDNEIKRLSDIEDHKLSTEILSSIYKSAYLRKKNKNSLIKLKVKK